MKTLRKAVLAMLALSVAGFASGDGPAPPAPGEADHNPASEIAALQAQIAEQRKQIDQLNAVLAEQSKVLERLSVTVTREAARTRPPGTAQLASVTPMIVPPPAPARSSLDPLPASPLPAPAPQQAAAATEAPSPLQLR